MQLSCPNNTSNKLESRARTQKATFVKPTLKEVEDYCKERNNSVDAQKWFDHYEANGWRVGKNPMRDWQAAVRTWERNGVGQQQPHKPITKLEQERREFVDRNLSASELDEVFAEIKDEDL